MPTPEERADEARAFAKGELEQHTSDQDNYAKYVAERDAPPAAPPDIWGQHAKPKPMQLESDIAAGHEADQANYNKYAAQRDKGAVPQTLPQWAEPSKPNVPPGFALGPNGGLVPVAPPTPSTPDAPVFGQGGPMYRLPDAPQGEAGPGDAGGGAPAPSQGTYVPGGWQPSSRNAQTQHGITGPEVDTARAEYSAATGLGLSGVNHQISAEQQRNDAAKAIAQQEYKATVETNAKLAALATRKSQAEDDGFRQVQGLTQEVREGKVDPDHMWAERGTAARIFSIIGVAMGAFVAAKTGGPNLVLQQVNGEIDRDIEAQKANLAGKQRGLENAKGLLAMNLQRFGNMEQAILASRAMAKEQAAKEFDALTAGSKDQDVLANAAKQKAAILNSGGDDMAKLAQIAGDRVVTSEADAYRPGGMVGGDTGGGNPKAPDELFVPTGPNGKGYRARTKEEAVKGRALEDAYEAMKNVVDDGKATRSKTGLLERGAGNLGIYETEDFSHLSSVSGQAVMAVKKAEDMGALDKGAAEYGGKIVGDMSKTRGNPGAAAESYLTNLGKKRDAFERAQAGQGAQQTIRRDTSGNLYTRSAGEATVASLSPGMPAMTAVDGRSLPATPKHNVQRHLAADASPTLFADDASIKKDIKPASVSKTGIKPKHPKGRH